jgi:hypothetical protein
MLQTSPPKVAAVTPAGLMLEERFITSPTPKLVVLLPEKLSFGVSTPWNEATVNDVDPTVRLPPSGLEIEAVMVAVPADRPLTTTAVLLVNVPVGVTIATGLEIESEIGIVLPELTVAFIVAVWPTMT